MKFNDLQIGDVRLFAAVTESGGLIAGAALLDIPSSSASRSLRRLEAWAGRPLFDRRTKCLELTPDGITFLSSARQMLDNQDKIAAELRSQVGTLARRLIISATHDFGCTQIAPCIADFLAMYPEIDIVLELSNRVGFVKGKADLCVSIGDIGDDGWVKRPLATERVMLCAAPAYLNANGHPKRLEDLASHRLLAASSTSSSTAMTLPCRSQTHQIAGTIQLRSNDPKILMAAALQGVGITCISASFMAKELETGALVAVLPHLDLLPQSINAAYDPYGSQSHAAQVFLEFLIARMKLYEAAQ